MESANLRGVIKFSIGLLCAAAFMLILIILSGNELDDTSAKAVGTAAALALLSLTGAAGSHLASRQPQLSLLGYITVLASGLAFLVTAAAIWSDGGGNWKLAGSCLIIAFACGHSSALLARSGDRDGDGDGVRAVRVGTLISLWLLTVMALAEISASGDDLAPQAFGVVAVLYVLGAILQPLLRRLESPRPEAPEQEHLKTDHVCFVWPGTAESAVRHLTDRGVQVVEGPVPRIGAGGTGLSLYYRGPDGGLIELISYS